jgi:mono/diheme cytochrome c family protein
MTSSRPEQYVGNGRPAMPAWSEAYGGPLRDDQIREIAKFVLNWESTAMGSYVPATPAAAAADAQSDDPVVRGQAVYLANGCGGCHALGSISAGIVGPALNTIGTDAGTRVPDLSAEEYILTSILDPQAFIASECPSGPCPENVMPKNFNELISEEQLNDLVTFLMAQK